MYNFFSWCIKYASSLHTKTLQHLNPSSKKAPYKNRDVESSNGAKIESTSKDNSQLILLASINGALNRGAIHTEIGSIFKGSPKKLKFARREREWCIEWPQAIRTEIGSTGCRGGTPATRGS